MFDLDVLMIASAGLVLVLVVLMCRHAMERIKVRRETERRWRIALAARQDEVENHSA